MQTLTGTISEDFRVETVAQLNPAWDDAMGTAVDAVESALYQKARSGDTVPMIFYLKAHRPIYRDRVTINVAQVQNEVEERLAKLKEKLPASSTAELIKNVLLPGR